jgi:small subunit ribosomal protein S16
MLVIRFFRIGKRGQPSFKIIVGDKRNPPRGGRFVEEVGFWNPLTKEKVLRADRIKYWLSVGAKPSDTVYNFLIREKILEGKKIPVYKTKKEKSKLKEAGSKEEKIEREEVVKTQEVEKPKEDAKSVEAEKPKETEEPEEKEKMTETKEEEKTIDPIRNCARPAESGAAEGPKGQAISNGVDKEVKL